MRRELLALGLTAAILVSLFALSQPSSAVLTAVSGPEEVNRPDEVTLRSTVEIRDDERIPVESFVLTIETDDGESVAVTFAPDGTVETVTPAGGVVGEGEIRVDLLRRTLDITPVEQNAEFGYGFRSGTDERTGETREFGYGYGFTGDGGPGFAFDVSMDSKALKQGDYTVSLAVNTGDGQRLFESNEKDLEVVLPSGGQPGDDADSGDRGADDEGDGSEDRDRGSAPPDDRGRSDDDAGEDPSTAGR